MSDTRDMHISVDQRLSLLEHTQRLSNTGSWQWDTVYEQFFWTETLFSIFNLPVAPGNLISLADLNMRVHPADLPAVQKYWEELKAGKKLDFYFKIVTGDDEIKHVRFSGETFEAGNGEKVTQGCCTDVTNEKGSAVVLKEYAAELELELKTFHRSEQVALSGTWQVNLETHETWYSDNVYRLYGLVPQTLPAHLNTFTPYIHPEDKTVVTNASEMAYGHRVPLHLEYRIIRNDGVVRYLRLVSIISKGINGEDLLVGISQDITEQKQLELQLRASNQSLDIQNQHFRQTEQIAQTGTWQVNMETRVAYYSDNLYRLYGLKPTPDMHREDFMQFVYSEDRGKVEEAGRKAYEEYALPNISFRVIRNDGKLRYFSQSAKLLTNDDGEPIMTGVVQDVTEHHLMGGQLENLNRELKIQNEAFTQAEQTSGIGTWRWNLDTNEIFYSDNIYRIYGLKPQSVKPGYESFHQYFHPDDIAKLKEIPGIMQQQGTPVEVNYRIYRADGELRHLRGRNRLIISDSGQRIMIGTTQDVTAEVQLKEKLDEQFRFIKLLTNNLVDQVMVTNTSNTIIEFNKAAETQQGIGRDAVIGKNFFEVFPQSRTSQLIDNFKRALKGELIRESNIVSPLNKGIVERVHIPVKEETGKVIGVITVIRDVTEEYHLEQQLQNRLAFIERLVDASLTRIIALDKDLNYILWNKPCEEWYKKPKEKVLGKNILEFYPSLKKEPFYDDIRRCLAGEVVYIPATETKEEGYHEARLVPLTDAKGEVSGLLWMIYDLSQTREAERKVEESRKLLQQTADATPDSITIYNLQTSDPFYVNDRLANWIGVTSSRLISMGVEGRLLLIHPEDRKRLLQFNKQMCDAGDDEVKTIEYRILTKQKHYLWIRNRSKVFRRDGDGKVSEIISVLQDITEQKKAEHELKESRLFMEQVMDATPDFILVFNFVTNKIDYVNRSGYKGDEARYRETLSLDYDGILDRAHPDDRKDLHDFIERLRTDETDEMHSIEYRVVKDNGVIWYQSRGKVFKRNEYGKPLSYISVVHDISGRKKLEQELEESKALLFSVINSNPVAASVSKIIRDENGEVVTGQTRKEEQFNNFQAALEHEARKQTNELKEKNKQLQNATREWQNILNAIPHYLWTSLPDGMNIFFNAQWVKESGIDPSSNPDAWQSTIHKDDLERTLHLWEQSLISGSEYYNEIRIRNTRGEYRWHIARAVPLKDRQGNIRLWLGTATDIHEIRSAGKKGNDQPTGKEKNNNR